MFKNLMNNTQFGVGKSIYNVESNSSSSTSSDMSLTDFINSLASVATTTTTSTISNESGVFSNVTADTITTNVLTVLQNFYLGEEKLLQIALSDNTSLSGSTRQDIIITTINHQSSNLIYTSIILNTPYIFSEPDYVPNGLINESPDNFLEIYDSKFKVTGPFTEIKSQKAVITSPIFTVAYLDRVDFNTDGSTTINPTPYDRGIAFEYVNNGNINFGFYGYSTQYDRFVFYKNAIENGTTPYSIYKNGFDTGETGIHTDYNVTRADNTHLTSVEADNLYSHIINSSDQIYVSSSSSILDRSLTINSYGKLTVNVNQDTQLTPGTFDYEIKVKSNILESAYKFDGTYNTTHTILCQNSYFGTTSNQLTSFNINSSTINLFSYSSSASSINMTTSSSGGINIVSGTNNTNMESTGNIVISSGSAKSIIINGGSAGLTEYSTGLITIQSTLSNISMLTGTSGSIINTSGSGGISNLTTGNINMTSGSSNSINMTSGTNGFNVESTGNININTSVSGKKININTSVSGNVVEIGNDSTIKLNDYAQLSHYLSIGSLTRNTNTIFELSTNLTSSEESTGMLIIPTITNFYNNNVQSFKSFPTIITQANSDVELITNMSLYPTNLTIGSSGSVTKSVTLYIEGETSNAQSNYSLYSKIGNIFFGGSEGNIFFNSDTNKFQLNDTQFELTQSVGNSNPYLTVSNLSQQLNYYTLSSTNLVGSGELYIDGESTLITMIDNNIYNGIGTLSAIQFDGTSCYFQINFTIMIKNGLITIKSLNTNMILNDQNNFCFELKTNMLNNILFYVTSLNFVQTNWNCNIAISNVKI